MPTPTQFLALFLLSALMTACQGQPIPQNKQPSVPATELKPPTTQTFKSNLVTQLNPNVLSILQDKNKHYWFGTNEGVYRYDGQSLIRFTTQDGLFQNQVQHIQEDEKGHLWFETGGYGVNRFDGQTITTFKTKDEVPRKNSPDKHWPIAPGDLWFYAGGGVFQYSRDTFRYRPLASKPPYQFSTYGVYSTLKDRSGKLWLGTQSMGVCCFDGKDFRWFTEYGLKGPAVLDLFEDSKGHLWFGTNGNGVFRYDGKTLRNFTAEQGLTNPDFIKNGKQGPGTLARVWSINEDLAGNIWLGTGDAGVWRYDGTKLHNYTSQDGLPDKGIEVIYRDQLGELWFGTNGAGVYRFQDEAFTKFTVQ